MTCETSVNFPGIFVYPFLIVLVEGDEAVQDLVFLEQRTKSKTSASLVASGPGGKYSYPWSLWSILLSYYSWAKTIYFCESGINYTHILMPLTLALLFYPTHGSCRSHTLLEYL